MRTVKYDLKRTSASTQYYAVNQTDKDWILNTCTKIVQFVQAAEQTTGDDLIKSLVDGLKKSDRTLPWRSHQHGAGANSVYTMCAGTLDNFKSATQYDFSEKTATGITRAFARAYDLGLAVTPVTFVERGALPAVETTSTSTYLDLFEVDIKITVRKKQ